VEVEVLRVEREDHAEPHGFHDGMAGLLDVVMVPVLVLDPARVETVLSDEHARSQAEARLCPALALVALDRHHHVREKKASDITPIGIGVDFRQP
jgi:hypothetical protein